jgi:hypothetical protein
MATDQSSSRPRPTTISLESSDLTPRPRYTLAELMEQCDLSAPVSEESRVWLDAEPVGHEIL